MEECSVLIETTKSAEDKTSRWFDLSIDYELFRDQLGVEVLHKKISTHLLTVLIISVILQLEQRKGNRKEQRGKEVRCQRFQEVSRHPRFQKITSKIKHREYRKRRDDLC